MIAFRRAMPVAVLTVALLSANGVRGQEDRIQGRSMVMSRSGIVAAEHPLAAQAGALVLARGGTAADAAVAANAVMGVVAPMMNGIGGDLVALVYDPRSGRTAGLEAVGWSAAAASVAGLTGRDGDRIPAHSVDAVTVPGTVDGWDKLLRRFGRLSFADVLAPAIAVAESGFPVGEVTAGTWAEPVGLEALRGDAEGTKTFLPGGRPPSVGQLFADPDLARSLRLIAAGGRDAFYRDDTAARILAALAKRGGAMRADDLADYAAEWVEPVSASYRGWTVTEMPPSTMGFAALEMLGIMGTAPMRAYGPGSVRDLHTMIEAKKLAYADLLRFDGDPRSATVPVAGLLAEDYPAAAPPPSTPTTPAATSPLVVPRKPRATLPICPWLTATA